MTLFSKLRRRLNSGTIYVHTVLSGAKLLFFFVCPCYFMSGVDTESVSFYKKLKCDFRRNIQLIMSPKKKKTRESWYVTWACFFLIYNMDLPRVHLPLFFFLLESQVFSFEKTTAMSRSMYSIVVAGPLDGNNFDRRISLPAAPCQIQCQRKFNNCLPLLHG